jgi:hypothetical protein
MAGWNALTGARGVVAAFGMSALLQLGVVNVTTGLLLCAVITGTGALLFSRVAASTTATGAEDQGAPARPGSTERAIGPNPTLVGRAVAGLRGAAAR